MSYCRSTHSWIDTVTVTGAKKRSYNRKEYGNAGKRNCNGQIRGTDSQELVKNQQLEQEQNEACWSNSGKQREQ